jgi:hypothetical protein
MTIPETAITDSEGRVFLKWALTHRNLDPMQKNHVAKITGSDAVRSFNYNWNIAGAFVTPQEAEILLTVKLKICNCNNGTYHQAFTFGSLLDKNLFTAGNREGVLR